MKEADANEATDFIDQLLRNSRENPFLYEPHGRARIISGEEQGIFSWIAANYLEKDFTTDEGMYYAGRCIFLIRMLRTIIAL